MNTELLANGRTSDVASRRGQLPDAAPSSTLRRLRAAAVITLVWGGFMGVAGCLMVATTVAFAHAPAALWSRMGFVFVRFGAFGLVLGTGFTAIVAWSTRFRPTQSLSERRAGTIGLVTSAGLTALILHQAYAGLTLTSMLISMGAMAMLGGLLGRTFAYTAREGRRAS